MIFWEKKKSGKKFNLVLILDISYMNVVIQTTNRHDYSCEHKLTYICS